MVHKKILDVMKDIEYLSKDDTISYGTTNYKGLSEGKVTAVVRESMVRHGLIVFPIKQEHKREGNLSTVDVTYRFVDTEDDSFIDAVSSGTGVDTQDKGVGKAMTYAYKYLFLRTFALPTGEDPDKISSEELDDREKNARIEEGKRTIRQLVEDYENLLDGSYLAEVTAEVDVAQTIDEVKRIYRGLSKETKRIETDESKARQPEAINEAVEKLGLKKATDIDKQTEIF